MTSIGFAFDIVETEKNTPVGFKRTSGHMTFDIKMNFTRNARQILDGNRQPSPEGYAYSGAISQESVRMAFTWVAKKG